jgi:hypothetical protein
MMDYSQASICIAGHYEDVRLQAASVPEIVRIPFLNVRVVVVRRIVKPRPTINAVAAVECIVDTELRPRFTVCTLVDPLRMLPFTVIESRSERMPRRQR